MDAVAVVDGGGGEIRRAASRMMARRMNSRAADRSVDEIGEAKELGVKKCRENIRYNQVTCLSEDVGELETIIGTGEQLSRWGNR